MNFYKRFIKSFFHITVRLTSMLKSSEYVLKKRFILWISELLILKTANFFYKLIQIFTTAFFLQHFDLKKKV